MDLGHRYEVGGTQEMQLQWMPLKGDRGKHPTCQGCLPDYPAEQGKVRYAS